MSAYKQQEPGGADILQLVTFKLGAEEFSVEILKVQEIIRLIELTRVPKAPSFIDGVINLRGNVIPVMDLRKRFGIEVTETTNDTRIIIVEIGEATVGFKVDAVNEVLRISTDTIEPPPSMVSGVDSEYIEGVGKLEDRLLILLNVDKILADSEKIALEGIQEEEKPEAV